ncbi:MAG: hypothetical protein AABX53_03655 [Nanoarchaeota archaeon]
MTNTRKSYFDERTVGEIRDMQLNEVKGNLAASILECPPDRGIVIARPVIPARFYNQGDTSADATRRWYKHGFYLPLWQPQTIKQALEERIEPHRVREATFDAGIRGRKEESITAQGYVFRPIQGTDKRKRLVPFTWIPESMRIFAYAMKETKEGLPVSPFVDAQKVAVEGGEVIVRVPSRTEKKERYVVRLGGVPIVDTPQKFALAWSVRSNFLEARAPEHETFGTIRYKPLADPEQSEAVFVYPQMMTAYLATAQHMMNTERMNTVPWDMNPFPKVSRLTADFYRKLLNNVLVTDERLKKPKHQLRKLYVAERSALLAKLIGLKGTRETFFWLAGGQRDPPLSDYDWSIPT